MWKDQLRRFYFHRSNAHSPPPFSWEAKALLILIRPWVKSWIEFLFYKWKLYDRNYSIVSEVLIENACEGMQIFKKKPKLLPVLTFHLNFNQKQLMLLSFIIDFKAILKHP